MARRLLPPGQVAKHINVGQSERGITMWKRLVFCFVALASVALTSCNTIQGAGKDVERGGQKIQEEANEHKPK
jgi:entericidin B